MDHWHIEVLCTLLISCIWIKTRTPGVICSTAAPGIYASLLAFRLPTSLLVWILHKQTGLYLSQKNKSINSSALLKRIVLDVLIAPRLSFFFFFFGHPREVLVPWGVGYAKLFGGPWCVNFCLFFRWENSFQGLLGLILVYLTYSTIWKKVLEYPNLYKYLLKKKKSFQNILDLKDDMTRYFFFWSSTHLGRGPSLNYYCTKTLDGIRLFPWLGCL